jgi:hypothetical protein
MYTPDIMPDLTYLLSIHELGFLRIVAELWGFDLVAPDARGALPELTHHLRDPLNVTEMVEALPDDARKALDTILENDGVVPWQRFTRQFGELREMGPGKRDREKPHHDPISPTEWLWYRALIGRDFMHYKGELQDCAYVPDELLHLMPPVRPVKPQPLGRAASPGETAHTKLAADRVLDHTCTLLAALRMKDPKRSPAVENWQPPYDVVYALLAGMKLISSSEQPVAEDARPFLEMSRGEALAWLVRGWLSSELFNELRLMPGLVCEGAWHNDPRIAREKLIAFLSEVTEGVWWHIDSFVNAIQDREPDFQRPAGDFDSWLVRDALTGESLTGVSHWSAVDGALIRFMLTGPMHWLGLIDLSLRRPGEDPVGFKLSAGAEQLLLGKPQQDLPEEDQPIEVFSDGRLIAKRLTPRLARYQLSRFGDWTKETQQEYVYQLTSSSLAAASEQGLKISHLETLLNKYGETIPPNLLQALHQWDQKGGEVHIQPAVILRVDNAKILQALRSSPAARFLGDGLGPTSVIIKPGAIDKVRAALLRMGYLSEVGLDELDHEAGIEEL